MVKDKEENIEKPELKSVNGITLYVVIGGWGPPRINWDRGIRICLGFIAIALVGYDIENLINNAGAVINSLKRRLQNES